MKKLEIQDTSKGLFPEPYTSEVSAVEAALNAHRKICLWQHKIDRFQRKIDETKGEFNSKKIDDFDLFKVVFPRNITGYIYDDSILNEGDPSETRAIGTKVLFKELRCHLHFSGDIRNFPDIYVKVLLENLLAPSFHYEKEIIYRIEISHLFLNWISEHDSDKKGFANSSYNSPLIGQALIFNDDNIREDINLALKQFLEKFRAKFGQAPDPLHWTEEQIKSARGEISLRYM